MNGLPSLFHTDLPWWNLVVRAGVVYIAVLLLLRLAGKRQVAQMSMIELVAVLLISNAVQNSMNGGDNSLLGGIILAAVILLLSTALAYATYRNCRFERWVHGRPTLLIHHGKILHERLSRELMTVKELKQILRKQSIHNLLEVAEAVLESDGFVSVVKKEELQEEWVQERNDVY